jgi:manganese-dependent inorganic pyrophosphatase
MPKPLYIIGHRSPDTDSVCSAIGYAHLKQALGEPAVPARAGKLNAETKYVLDYFGVEAPVLISDLYPRAEDIMAPNPVTISPGHTLRELGTIMKEYRIKSAPVIDENNILVGMVSLGDLAKRYFDELSMPDLRAAGVDFDGILRVVDGDLLHGKATSRLVTGRVWIIAARSQTAQQLIRKGDIILVGDRTHAQLTCIACGIDCMIVTGNADVAPEVLQAADAHDVVIIKAPYDTYTCARLITQSIPVRMVMQKNIVTFKPSDLISDIRNVISRTNYRSYPVIDQGKLVGMISRDRLIVLAQDKVILVDHNERSQAVDGIEEVQIVEIVDHHRLGGLETSEPIFIRHEPVGSTATIVANLHWHRNVDIPPSIAGLLLAAVISDTLLFKSPTTTPSDRQAAVRLADIAGLDLEQFGLDVLKAGSVSGDLPVNDLIAGDLKELQIGEYSIAISQTFAMNVSETLATGRDVIIEALEAMCLRAGYDLAVLMATDVLRESTHLFYAGKAAGLMHLAFGSDVKEGVVYLPGTMSRKKQVLPRLIEAARAERRAG